MPNNALRQAQRQGCMVKYAPRASTWLMLESILRLRALRLSLVEPFVSINCNATGMTTIQYDELNVHIPKIDYVTLSAMRSDK